VCDAGDGLFCRLTAEHTSHCNLQQHQHYLLVNPIVSGFPAVMLWITAAAAARFKEKLLLLLLLLVLLELPSYRQQLCGSSIWNKQQTQGQALCLLHFCLCLFSTLLSAKFHPACHVGSTH